jgi:hypothetical protein
MNSPLSLIAVDVADVVESYGGGIIPVPDDNADVGGRGVRGAELVVKSSVGWWHWPGGFDYATIDHLGI